jgi:chromosome segregation ATPase
MNTLAKVFIVVNFLLAVIFMVATLTLYAKRTHWHEQFSIEQKKSLDTREKYTKLEAEHVKLVQESALNDSQLKEKLATAREKFLDAQRTIDTLENANTKLSSNLDELRVSLTGLEDQLANKEKRNVELVADNLKAEQATQMAKKKFKLAETRSVELMAQNKSAEAELLNLSKRVRALIEEKLALQHIIQQVVDAGHEIPKGDVVVVSGRVLQVDEAHELVILNIGEQDKVSPGMQLVLSRGSQYVGKVQIRKVYKEMASATFLPAFMKDIPQANDLAETY